MTDFDTHAANVAQTMRDTVQELGGVEPITATAQVDLSSVSLVSVPKHRNVQDISGYFRDALLRAKPERRKGKATLKTLDSLIDWANRFKGQTSALFADTSTQPSLTCISNYHGAGAGEYLPDSGEEGAAFCDHRGVYTFPVSDKWALWAEASASRMDKDELAEFIDANIEDFLDPTPHLINGKGDAAPWEERMHAMAQKIEGRFGQVHELVNLSRQFEVHETSNIQIKTNRDDGTASLQFVNEHKDAEGQPLRLPNFFLIAIPVFDGADLYRLAVRFRYKKAGAKIVFTLQVHNAQAAFDDACQMDLAKASAKTGLPLFHGTPES